MRCPNCGVDNQQAGQRCKICGTTLPTSHTTGVPGPSSPQPPPGYGVQPQQPPSPAPSQPVTGDTDLHTGQWFSQAIGTAFGDPVSFMVVGYLPIILSICLMFLPFLIPSVWAGFITFVRRNTRGQASIADMWGVLGEGFKKLGALLAAYLPPVLVWLILTVAAIAGSAFLSTTIFKNLELLPVLIAVLFQLIFIPTFLPLSTILIYLVMDEQVSGMEALGKALSTISRNPIGFWSFGLITGIISISGVIFPIFIGFTISVAAIMHCLMIEHIFPDPLSKSRLWP